MTSLVWMILKNGRSVIAGCGRLNREAFESLMKDPQRRLTLTAQGSIDYIQVDQIREFRIFDANFRLPSGCPIYDVVCPEPPRGSADAPDLGLPFIC